MGRKGDKLIGGTSHVSRKKPASKRARPTRDRFRGHATLEHDEYSLPGGAPVDDAADHPPPRCSVPLAMWDFKQCDSKRCTGRKLARLRTLRVRAGWQTCVVLMPRACVARATGFVKTLQIGDSFRGIVLSPNGTRAVSPEDRVRPARCAARCAACLFMHKAAGDCAATRGLGD